MLSFEESGSTLECKFKKELTTAVCTEIKNELNEKIMNFVGQHDNVKVVFDLAEIQYVCSAFLHLCLYYCKTVGVGSFRIVNVLPPVINILNLAGFIEIMTIEPAKENK